MPFSIQTNVNSLVAQENLRVNSNFQSQTIQRLTSGYRINSSGDDAAGLAIANKFRSDTAELTQGVRNANDGISQLQIIDGGMNNVSKMLDRLRTLATQSSSATFTNDQRVVADQEFQSLLGEINRQAQSIGLDSNGQFNKALSVFIGGGRVSGTGAVSTDNGSVTVDLAGSAMDTKTLGLQGMQAKAAASDLSASSATSAYNVVNNAANKASESTPGSTVFYFSGAGFSDSNKVSVSVNLSGVSDAQGLASAINTAIQASGQLSSPAAAAFKAAGVTASVHTDASGAQQIAFTSSKAAFQVQAGDQMSNAIMGNFSTGSTGTSTNTSVTGQTMDTATNVMANNVEIKFTGGGLSAPKTLQVLKGTNNVGQMATAVVNAVNTDASLKAAGISAAVVNSQLVFTNSRSEEFNTEVSGDLTNQLGLGAFRDSGSASDADATLYAGAAYAAGNITTTTAGAAASFEFSVGGGAAVALAPISLAGGNATAATATLAAISSPVSVVTGQNDTLTFALDGHNITTTLTAGGTAGQSSTLTPNLFTATAPGVTIDSGNDTFLLAVDGGGPVRVTLTDDTPLAAKTVAGAGNKFQGTVTIDNTNNKFNLTVDSGTSHVITLANNAAYDSGTIITEIDSKIGQYGAHTTLDGNGNLSIVSNTIGNNSKIVLTAGAQDAVAALGMTATGAGGVVGTSGYDASTAAANVLGAINSAGAAVANKVTVDVVNGSLVIKSKTLGSNSVVSLGQDGTSQALTRLGLNTATDTGQDGWDANHIAAAMQQSISDAQASGNLAGTTIGATVAVNSATNVISIVDSEKGASHTITVDNTSNAVTSASYQAWGSGYADGSTNGALLGTNRTGSDLAQALDAALKSNATLAAAGLGAAWNGVSGGIDISGTKGFRMNAGAGATTGNVLGNVDITNGADFSHGAMNLKVSVNGGAATTVTLNQNYATGALLASAINSQLGGGASAAAVSSNGKLYLEIKSAVGVTKSVQVQSDGTANSALGMTDNSVHAGTAQKDVGFGATGITNTGVLGLAAASSALSVLDAGGTMQTGALSFSNITSGTQALTISANDANGGMQSLSITLASQGAATASLGNAGSGDNIDQAVSYINSQLQKTNNATLQQIVAVKQLVNGAEQINFIGSSDFQVGVGTAGSSQGLNAGTAKNAVGAQVGSGSNVSILSQSDALAAVNAVAAAVAKLGTAQAAVGKGQNQLNYAVNLAQSQISNFSSAESRIRDADVASEAANLTKASVLQQASIAAMAQANSAPQAVLSLLRG